MQRTGAGRQRQFLVAVILSVIRRIRSKAFDCPDKVASSRKRQRDRSRLVDHAVLHHEHRPLRDVVRERSPGTATMSASLPAQRSDPRSQPSSLAARVPATVLASASSAHRPSARTRARSCRVIPRRRRCRARSARRPSSRSSRCSSSRVRHPCFLRRSFNTRRPPHRTPLRHLQRRHEIGAALRIIRAPSSSRNDPCSIDATPTRTAVLIPRSVRVRRDFALELRRFVDDRFLSRTCTAARRPRRPRKYAAVAQILMTSAPCPAW